MAKNVIGKKRRGRRRWVHWGRRFGLKLGIKRLRLRGLGLGMGFWL